jgi:hypothetical protein
VLQTTPLVAGVGIATAALLGREVVKQYIRFKAAPAAARAFYKVNMHAALGTTYVLF